MIDGITNHDMPQDSCYMVVSDTIIIDRTLASCAQGRIRCGKNYENDQHVICKMSKNKRIIEHEVEVLMKLNLNNFDNFPCLIA